MKTNIVFIVGRPATGKTRLSGMIVDRAKEQGKEAIESISITTREIRKEEGEINGVHYHFIKEEDIEKDELLEYKIQKTSKGGEALYGTPLAPIDKAVGRVHAMVFVLEVDGYKQAREKIEREYKNEVSCILVITDATSDDILVERLKADGYSEEDASKRIYREDQKSEIEALKKEASFVLMEKDSYEEVSEKVLHPVVDRDCDTIEEEVVSPSLKI